MPPAGYGVVAVQGASLETTEHSRGAAVFEMCGSVIPGGVANATVKTTTNNVAELVAFTRGLTWAAYHPLAQQQPGVAHPVCMRYDSVYAAMIATGVWRAKKHKEMAAAARQAWATLMKRTRGRLWLKHVKGHSGHTWNDVADRPRATASSSLASSRTTKLIFCSVRSASDAAKHGQRHHSQVAAI